MRLVIIDRLRIMLALLSPEAKVTNVTSLSVPYRFVFNTQSPASNLEGHRSFIQEIGEYQIMSPRCQFASLPNLVSGHEFGDLLSYEGARYALCSVAAAFRKP